ncbi:MAG: TolC family protein [Paludibacter sp.]|jgi:outer membrane protein TolC|nr:TolC family protein [Paludibacter sp.]
MRKKFLFLMVLAFATATYAQTSDTSSKPDTLKLSLPEALQIALSESPTIKIADKEIQRVDYSKKESWSGLFPTIDGTGSFQKYATASTMALAGMTIKLPSDWGASLGVQAALPLVAPALWQSIKMGETEMKLALAKATASKIDLRNNVSKAYYGVLLAESSYAVLQSSYKLAKQNYDQAKTRFNLGLAAEYDAISAEVQLNNLQPNILAVESGIRQAKLMLKVLLSIDASVELAVEGKLTNFETDVRGLNSERNVKLDNNVDLLQLDVQKQQLKEALSIQKTQFMPTLAAFAQYNYAGQGNKAAVNFITQQPSPASTSWYGQGLIVGLQLNVPIFHLNNLYKVKKLKVQAESLDIARDLTESQLKVQARSALDNMDKADKQVEAAKKAITLAQKGFDISSKRYENGGGTILELNAATVSLSNAQLSYNQAISDYLNAKADLDKILGVQN